ncbi:site-specific integrase [Alkalihalophilus pseudofirmus OF4]|uniref:Site-specific integrase n=1 Tax=Alkalihalophilus pseudofirmus (strain ATCC BAA-2126 / JCM 17055 / OF4) TaxID=398511 RepID=D3FYU1_ALKPO|nr:tyrosine-type recombinase/integrase [Alkalihalophilus pseudofirmus]ADC48974.1 site-specific integrase [Alkalihalophilus pseudofirmus OF4]
MSNRAGKSVKNERSGIEWRKSIYDLDALFEKYYDSKVAEGRAEGTLKSYRRVYGVFSEYLTNNDVQLDIRAIETDTVRGFVAWLLRERIRWDGHKHKPEYVQTKGLSPRSVNDHIKTLKTFFSFLVDEDLADFNPVSKVKKVRQIEKEIDVLTVDELKALMSVPYHRKYADFRDYVIMTFLLDTMCRINEVCTLRKRDIDFKDNTVHIRAEITKTRKGRHVPFQKRTARLLKELIKEVDVFDSEYIFLSNYGEQLEPNHFRSRLKGFAKKAGIERNVHPHLFRHTGATMFLEAGGDIRHLQLILGHADLRMTTRYTHVSGKSIAKQHEQYSPINGVIGKLNKERKILR